MIDLSEYDVNLSGSQFLNEKKQLDLWRNIILDNMTFEEQ